MNNMNTYVQAKQGDFTGVIEFFKKDISVLRTGRANPAILEGILVDAYGAKSPLNGVAGVTVSDARSIVISPWDKSVLKDIEKAVVEADLGFGVVNEGDKLRLTVPAMTEENRKELVKKLNEKMEEARINVRKVREDVKKAIEAAEEAGEFPEDFRFQYLEELEKEVAKYNEELKTLRDKKDVEIMTI